MEQVQTRYNHYVLKNLMLKDESARRFMAEDPNMSPEHLTNLYHAANSTKGSVFVAQLGKAIVKKGLCQLKQMLARHVPLINVIEPEQLSDTLSDEDYTAIVMYHKANQAPSTTPIHPWLTIGRSMLFELLKTNINLFTLKMNEVVNNNDIPIDVVYESAPSPARSMQKEFELVDSDDEDMEEDCPDDVMTGDGKSRVSVQSSRVSVQSSRVSVQSSRASVRPSRASSSVRPSRVSGQSSRGRPSRQLSDQDMNDLFEDIMDEQVVPDPPKLSELLESIEPQPTLRDLLQV